MVFPVLHGSFCGMGPQMVVEALDVATLNSGQGKLLTRIFVFRFIELCAD